MQRLVILQHCTVVGHCLGDLVVGCVEEDNPGHPDVGLLCRGQGVTAGLALGIKINIDCHLSVLMDFLRFLPIFVTKIQPGTIPPQL